MAYTLAATGTPHMLRDYHPQNPADLVGYGGWRSLGTGCYGMCVAAYFEAMLRSWNTNRITVTAGPGMYVAYLPVTGPHDRQ